MVSNNMWGFGDGIIYIYLAPVVKCVDAEYYVRFRGELN